MDPATCAAAQIQMDLDGAIRYVSQFAETVKDNEYVCVPYNYP